MFLRRLGESAQSMREFGHHCPQILETIDHDFAAVGPLITEEAVKALLSGPGVELAEGVGV